MSLQVNSAFISFVAGEAIPIYRRVKLSAGTVVLAGATDVDFLGVSQAAAASGAACSVRLKYSPGTFFVTASAAITANDPVYAGANGKVAATGTCAIGVALEASGADDNQIEVIFSAAVNPTIVAAGIHVWAGGAAATDSITVAGLQATDVVICTLTAVAGAELLSRAVNDSANAQIDLTLSANGTNATTKINYLVVRAV